MPERVRVLVVVDPPADLAELRLALGEEPEIELIGDAFDGREAVALANRLRPDVVLMGIASPDPGDDVLYAAQQIKAECPHIQILALSRAADDELLCRLIEAGASVCLFSRIEMGELLEALRIVARGELFLSPPMTRKLARYYVTRNHGQSGGDQLSAREREIIRLVAQGFSNKEIAEELVISPSTVYTHRGRLMAKLGLRSGHELTHYAQRLVKAENELAAGPTSPGRQ